MKSLSFFAFQDADHPYSFFSCNRASSEQALIVNCAGMIDTPFYFSTDGKGKRVDFYLMYLVEGKLEYQFDGETRVLSAGSVVIYPPKYRYIYSHVAGENVCYYYAHFTGGEVAEILGEYHLEPLLITENFGKSRKIIGEFEQLFHAISKKEPYFERECALSLGSVLLHIAKRISRQETPESAPVLRKSLEYLHTSFQEPINLEYLASLENLSVSHFCSLFKKSYGESPIRYLIDVRIENACWLLKNTDISIQDCARSCGYANEYFFSRQFKEKTGTTPSKFRSKFLL